VRIFQNRTFEQFARRNRIPIAAICSAAREISAGLIHANLGGGVYKQRIARKGEGKSGGFRSIIFFRVEHRMFFFLGFAKNAKANIAPKELADLKEYAKELLNYDDQQIKSALSSGAFIEILCPQAI
jgi:hypothetical protein